MAAYAQFGPGYHPPPTQFFTRSNMQMPPSLTAHVLAGSGMGSGPGGSLGIGIDGGAQSPIATTSSAPSTSPPLTVGRTDSGGGGIVVVGGGCSSGNNSNSSGGSIATGPTQCGDTPTPELQSSSTAAAAAAAVASSATASTPNDSLAANPAGICRSSSSRSIPPAENSLAYSYQSCNTSISTANLVQPSVSVSCCDNGRPVMTDPVSGQMICSCQYDPTRFTALSNYTRIQSAAGIGVYGTPYPSNEQNPYPSIGVESPPFYSSVTHPYALKDNGSGADVTPWTSGGLQTSASYYTYDPTFGAYGYGASYDLAARRKNATRESTATLKAWLNEHKKNPYPTKGEKIMLAIITKMTLTQVSTWFANARRRLKKENKMTWEPKNRTEEEDDALVSDEDKEHDDNDNNVAQTTTKQPSSYAYDARCPSLVSNGSGGGGAVGGGGGGGGGGDPAAIGETSVGGTGNGCVDGQSPASINKYNTTGTRSGSDSIDTAVTTAEPSVHAGGGGSGVLANIQQSKECYGLAYGQLRVLDGVEAANAPIYQRLDTYHQLPVDGGNSNDNGGSGSQSFQSLVQPVGSSWRMTAQYTHPYMDWSRLNSHHHQQQQQQHQRSPSGSTSVVATISLQSATAAAAQHGMRSATTAYTALMPPDRSPLGYHHHYLHHHHHHHHSDHNEHHTMNSDAAAALIKREPSEMTTAAATVSLDYTAHAQAASAAAHSTHEATSDGEGVNHAYETRLHSHYFQGFFYNSSHHNHLQHQQQQQQHHHSVLHHQQHHHHHHHHHHQQHGQQQQQQSRRNLHQPRNEHQQPPPPPHHFQQF